ncbi:MAG TPA: hypothetical protein VMF30_16075 [Pirellulales bacterium]|nr:hypothetical protein [Pirellulales bacterium]
MNSRPANAQGADFRDGQLAPSTADRRPRATGRMAARLACGLLAAACCLGLLLSGSRAADRGVRQARLSAAKTAATNSSANRATNGGAAESATGGASAAADSAEMFSAMKSGDLDVKFIPKDDREARITFTNKTKRPLSVKLPEAFAAVPVLAQRGAPGGMGGMGGMMGGMNQMMGGGMGGMGGGMMGGMGGGMGGGMFNVPAEKLQDGIWITVPAGKPASYRVATVCLEHGKRDPRPAVPYEIKPLESVMTKPGVAELLTLLGYGKIDQRGAQAAAWHLANGMSWEQLAQKRIQTPLGDGGPYFSADQISIGVDVAEVAMTAAATRAGSSATEKSPGDVQSRDNAVDSTDRAR